MPASRRSYRLSPLAEADLEEIWLLYPEDLVSRTGRQLPCHHRGCVRRLGRGPEERTPRRHPRGVSQIRGGIAFRFLSRIRFKPRRDPRSASKHGCQQASFSRSASNRIGLHGPMRVVFDWRHVQGLKSDLAALPGQCLPQSFQERLGEPVALSHVRRLS